MANESSPVCFRIPSKERALLEVVAQFQGQTLSAFARDAVIRVAQGIVETHGADTVFRKFETLETRRAAELTARLEGIREQLFANPREEATEAAESIEKTREELLPQQQRGLPD